MTVTADIITARKLAIVRQVYLEGTRQRANATPVSRLLAVIDYDLATETALKAAVRALDPAAPLKSDLRTWSRRPKWHSPSTPLARTERGLGYRFIAP